MGDRSRNFSPEIEELMDMCARNAKDDGSYAVAFALFTVSRAIFDLGFGESLHPGAIEGHTMKMMESLSSLSSSISEIATSLESVASAIEEKHSVK